MLLKGPNGREARLRRVPIYCPNSDTLGYSRRLAKPGDLVQYRETGSRIASGRFLGGVYPAQDGLEPCKGFLWVAQISEDLTFSYERWVDPKNVINVQPASRVLSLFRALFGEQIPNAQEIRSGDFITQGRG